MTVCIHECKGRTCSADAAFLHRSSAGAGHNLFTTQIEILTFCANSVCLTALCNNSFARHIHLRRCRNKLPTAAKQGLHCKAPLHVSGLPCSMDAGSRHRTVNLACVRFRKFSWPSLPTACIQLPQSSKPGCKSYHAWCPEQPSRRVCSPAGALAHRPAVIHHSHPWWRWPQGALGIPVHTAPPHPAGCVEGVRVWGDAISFWVGRKRQLTHSLNELHTGCSVQYRQTLLRCIPRWRTETKLWLAESGAEPR